MDRCTARRFGKIPNSPLLLHVTPRSMWTAAVFTMIIFLRTSNLDGRPPSYEAACPCGCLLMRLPAYEAVTEGSCPPIAFDLSPERLLWRMATSPGHGLVVARRAFMTLLLEPMRQLGSRSGRLRIRLRVRDLLA